MDGVFSDDEGDTDDGNAKRREHLGSGFGSKQSNRGPEIGGAKGIRTPDLLHAMQTRYQLRHSPAARENSVSRTSQVELTAYRFLALVSHLAKAPNRHAARRQAPPTPRVTLTP